VSDRWSEDPPADDRDAERSEPAGAESPSSTESSSNDDPTVTPGSSEGAGGVGPRVGDAWTPDPPPAPPPRPRPQPGGELPAAPAAPPPGWPVGGEASDVPAPPPPAHDAGWLGSGPSDDDLPVHPPVPHVPHAPPPPPRRRSRNPVDRLTRGLPDPLRVAVDWAVTILGAIAIVLLVKAFVVNPYRIPSSSMEPTLHCAQPASGCEARFSDRVLANRFLYHLRDPRRGEIVVFQTPPQAQVKCGAGGTFVKRLIGLPGETIEVRLEQGDGYVYVNGRKLAEPYVAKERRGAIEEFGPVKVPENAYFMMGDNRSQSCDSRVWGSVPRENLIGKVFATYWPPNRLSLH
jgi:signal peptidase I